MRTRHLFIALSLATAGTLPAFAYGPLIMVHGHADDPSLWTIQGSALVNSSGNTRFYDPKYYYSNELPAQFKTNGIYGVTYYSKNSANELEPTVICPVLAGTTELAPDDTSLRSFLYGQTDSYATRLASIINRAYADTGQKVTLVCHSMGGLVALSSVTYFGVQNKVERIITIGTPLRGFPADARVPADIIGLGRTNLFREGLQMSEGVKYAGQSFSEILESRFKLVRPAGLALVNVVGTFSPFPDDFLTGPSDGVVRAVDQRFRDSSLAPVYELPLVHIKNFRVAQYPDDQVECFSSRTTQILEKEALGLNPPPRLGTALTFNYGTGRIRVTVQNNGGLPVTFSSVSAQFEFLGPQGRVGTDSLGGLAN
ncbi:MAG: hypothetical protein NT154_27060, partial [Verrucomicrobia bacterium]|nr:hypothetical protein [Verrucomicrobiota bacterium]